MNLTKHTGSNDVSSGDADSPEYNKLLIEKCHIVAEYAHDMVRWVLPDRTLAYISPSSEKVTGYSPREFLEDPDLLIKIIHPDDTGWL
ncbi:MAG: PAS domain-containing protein, partial [Prolixibacteraceae bacterium]|nr:PAS domain-containing protein [Prolixibacteraceae bacterium]HOS91505.1 PAS domain-containing protein [Prolixibacteraceae bacterium]HPY28820.1 PAS domain-containing protein [Prolixibacteraceae bacterium]HQH77261.1 PAS domain-containing protein [Prolixibacteraceae bacterium]HQJ86710.1 PAS domain-containing protein [Prolixibacteraceae bacterium]